MRALPLRALAGAGLVLAGAAGAAGAAPAGTASCTEVRVVEVSGLLDDVLVDLLERSITDAAGCGAVAVVLQLDSTGAVVDRARVDGLLDLVATSTTPVAVWVGPPGAEARDEAAELVDAAAVVALAEGSIYQERDRPSQSAAQAFEAGITDIGPEDGSTIVSFVGSLRDHGIPVEFTEVELDDGRTVQQPVTDIRFSSLSLVDQLAHTFASPPVAYLLFVMGMALILFELFTAGVGVAGLVGAGFFVAGAYGLAVLPTSPWAVGLLVLAMFGFGIDVQTGVPRVWTGIATVAYVLGSVLLYRGDVALSWITLVISVAGMVLAMLGGMPAMVRSRFSTPTIGREWMIGEIGSARTAVDPDGVVLVRDAPWRARTNRATPIPAGAPVRVAAIDALVLEVEPLEGAARDSRERRAN